jgi:uncharacterized membrane protein YdfJ with MMPL/SSD domain
MLDPTTQQIGVGGAVAVVLVSAVLKFLPSFLSALKRNGNGSKSAGRTAEEWDNRIEAAAERALVKGAAQRHADLEKLMERVIEREMAKRDKVVREIIRDELRRR